MFSNDFFFFVVLRMSSSLEFGTVMFETGYFAEILVPEPNLPNFKFLILQFEQLL